MSCNENIVRRLRENRILNERKDYEKMDRNELIKLAKEGDQLAITTLVNQHKDFLFRMTYKYVPEGTFDRDDIMQIAEIAFWEAIKSWDMTGDFEAYAGMVIKRRLTDELRKLDTDKRVVNRNTKSIDAAESGDDEESSEMDKSEFDSWISHSSRSAEDEYLDREGTRALMKFLQEELTDVERQVIRLYIEGYKMAKIAEVTGLKYKSCENALMRAKNKLREYMRTVRESKQLREDKESIFSDEEKRILRRALNMIEESKKINESAIMTICPMSGINSSGFDIVIMDGDKKLFSKNYRWGWDASYSRENAAYSKRQHELSIQNNWEHKYNYVPYITDIVDDLCKEYGISRSDIQFGPGENVFANRKLTDKEVDDFKSKYFNESKKVDDARGMLLDKIPLEESSAGRDAEDMTTEEIEKVLEDYYTKADALEQKLEDCTDGEMYDKLVGEADELYDDCFSLEDYLTDEQYEGIYSELCDLLRKLKYYPTDNIKKVDPYKEVGMSRKDFM